MRFQKNLALCVAALASCSAFAAEPVPAGNPDPLPTLPILPGAPFRASASDADKTLPLGDPFPRPAATPSLLPDEIPAAPKRPATANPLPVGKPGATLKPQATAAELDLRIRYSKARNVAETNEKVRSAWEDSRVAKTDHAKRQALKRYYDLLFARMLSVDRGISPLVEKSRKAESAMLTQTQIAPTVPNE